MSRRVDGLGAVIIVLALLLSGGAPAEIIDYGVELPDPKIPGYAFPVASQSLLDAITRNDTALIYTHGWGLWASLTSPTTTPAYDIPNAPVYLTWLTKARLIALDEAPRTGPGFSSLATGRSRGLGLGPSAQLLKFGINTTKRTPRPRGGRGAASVIPDTKTFETVAYSPAAAQHIHGNHLFNSDRIKELLEPGKISSVPAFPNASVVIKTVYKRIPAAALRKGSYYAMPAWPGTPPVDDKIREHGFGEEFWPGCIYVDDTNQGPSSSTGIDANCGGASPGSSAVYGLGDFIGFTLDARGAAQLSTKTDTFSAGDHLILIAMHVTSREMPEWTWQTFFWTPAPKNPPLPSGKDVAAAQPSQLTSPQAHYAMSIGYQMISPNQPSTGGKNSGKPVIAYNPYLEAGFKMSSLPNSRPVVDPTTGDSWTGQVGVQTNCMTCHAMAAAADTKHLTHYGTDYYLSLDDPMFTGTVRTDFLWSIAGTVNPLSPPPKNKKPSK